MHKSLDQTHSSASMVGKHAGNDELTKCYERGEQDEPGGQDMEGAYCALANDPVHDDCDGHGDGHYQYANGTKKRLYDDDRRPRLRARHATRD